MKRVMLLFALCFSVMGCDGYCIMDFKVINQTNFEIVIGKNWNGEQVIIKSGAGQIIDQQGGTCPRGGNLTYKDNVKMVNADMKIGGIRVPDAIWTAKYWDLNSEKSHTIYTLIVTNELIESINLMELQ